MNNCTVCGGPAPTSPEDSSHDDCGTVVTFKTNTYAAAKILAALDTVLGMWAPMSADGEDKAITLAAFRTEFAAAAEGF